MFRTVTFVVEEKKHSRFERVDDDLVIKLNLSLSQALLGAEGGGAITKEVEQLDGRRIQVTVPEGVSHQGVVINADRGQAERVGEQAAQHLLGVVPRSLEMAPSEKPKRFACKMRSVSKASACLSGFSKSTICLICSKNQGVIWVRP